ncbi:MULTISPECIES: alpha/beta fold hydrolase [unclassified Nocardia]|uniref:alpha/beta fold hydrolase n=1 Tax=unclassified Nocardia TaxID=2637762 RepID=UPI001CE40FB9|nr:MULTISPECIES: alpha/beta fold hydrolase [unclassified Nocardia]
MGSGVGRLSGSSRRRAQLWVPGAEAAPAQLPPWRRIDLADGQRVVARVAEGETPILLLHGWAITADVNFCHVMQPLADEYGIVAMDMRGHGRGLPLKRGTRFDIAQCADDAAAVLDALGVEKVVVCGYSLGGPVGLEFALRHRDRVAGLVFQATAMAFDSTADKFGRVLFRALRPLADHNRRGFGRSAPVAYFRHVRSRGSQNAAWWPWLRSELVLCHPRVIVDVILAEYDFDFRPHAQDLAGLPVSSVITARDGAVPPHDQRELAALLNAKVFELDAAHDVFLTDPSAYTAATFAAIEYVRSHGV